MRVGIGMQLHKTLTYPIICQFPFFIALRDQNASTLQTGRWSISISTICHMLRGTKIDSFKSEILI